MCIRFLFPTGTSKNQLGPVGTDLTNIELEALLDVGVAAASGLVVLLQNQDLLAGFGQRGCGRQPADAAADHDDVQVLRNFIRAETCSEEKTTSQLIGFICRKWSCVTVMLHNSCSR